MALDGRCRCVRRDCSAYRIIDFEAFRPMLSVALAYGDGSKGCRPPYDPVAMLKVLILAA